MASSFFGLNVALQGLYTSKTALDVTNHNIANAETEGYSRQVAKQKASTPLPTYAGRGMIGTGSEVVAIEQLRNLYYDTKYWHTAKEFGEYDIKAVNLSQIETILNEPSDTGFSVLFNNMYDQLQNLSKNPSDAAYRKTFKDAAENFADLFNNLDEQFRELQRELNFAVKSKVEEINFIANQLSSINGQIASLELDGSTANDLRDERANLVDRLSKIVNVEVKEINEGNNLNTYRISIKGQVLVEGSHANFLEVNPRTYLNNPEDELDLYDVYWESGQVFDLTDPYLSGELKGYIDLRDGNNLENFTGDITAVDSTNDIVTIDNPSRTDISAEGFVTINGTTVKYTSINFDPTTGELQLNLDPTSIPPSATITVGSKVAIGDKLDYKGIPYYIHQLNDFVRTLAKEMNAVHKQGENLNGTSGHVLFSYNGYNGTTPLDETNEMSYNAITANNFTLDQAISDDINNIATTRDLSEGVENNAIILELLDLKEDIDMFEKGKPESYMQALISEMGIDAKQAKSFQEGQENMILAIKNQRLSFSGVDLNEETVNMLKYQKAYNLAAKMISVMNEIYDVTINRMGV